MSGSATCLNCEAILHGPYCSECGQPDRTPNPTLGEMAGDAWETISGYDSRFVRTLRLLLGRPGGLTQELLRGRRARYIPPVRLYLAASVVYFVVAAVAPNPQQPAASLPGSDIKIDIANPQELTPEQRRQAEASIERAPAPLKPFFRALVFEPGRVRRGFLEAFPRALFALVPVFAAIVALFVRGRRYSEHLLFALHFHSAVFVTLAVCELPKFTGNLVLIGLSQVAALIYLGAYSLLALRRVYPAAWGKVLLRASGIAILYAVAGVATLALTLAWMVFSV